MNYYEELGIRPDADEEEIRKAHRRLVKLMHPDQHRDQQMKQLAETQMRRLNSIVATLLDPEERRDYDDQLRGGVESRGAAAQHSTWRSVPWWIASTLGAIVLTVGAVWFWADRMGSRPNYNPSEVTGTSDQSSTTVRVPMIPHESAPAAAQPAPPEITSPSAPSSPSVPAAKPAEPAAPPVAPAVAPAPQPVAPVAKQTRPLGYPAAKPPVKSASAPRMDGTKKFTAVTPVVTVAPPSSHPLDASLRPPSAVSLPAGDSGIDIPLDHGSLLKPPPMGNRDPLEGEWVYAPSEPEKRKPGLYPPEFIQLKLIKEPDGMRGEYNARYDVADNRPVSPDVKFVLKSVDKTSLKYVWTAPDGTRGTFVIRSLQPDTMRLEWRQTAGKSGPALTSGVATLVRKN